MTGFSILNLLGIKAKRGQRSTVAVRTVAADVRSQASGPSSMVIDGAGLSPLHLSPFTCSTEYQSGRWVLQDVVVLPMAKFLTDRFAHHVDQRLPLGNLA